MSIWALADLHLSLGVPGKTMEIFGPHWVDYMTQIETNWRQVIGQDDLVLIAGDISWAMRLEEAQPDLTWIDQLPGTKVMIRGNHDYWWESLKKVRQILPPSIHVIQNDAFEWGNVSIGGSRLWDTSEYSCGQINLHPDPQCEKIYDREIARLEMSLRSMHHSTKIIMTHYPPIGFDLVPTRVSKMLTHYQVSDCVFGHLHALDRAKTYFGRQDGVNYHLIASDFLSFCPKKIL